MSTKERRGGRRQRRYAKKQLGAIDRESISALLKALAPDVAGERRELALAIVVKGIETFREYAPGERALSGTVQRNRRALERFKKGKAGAGIAPFNSSMRVGGKLYAASKSGLYRIDDVPLDGPSAGYEGLERAVADPLRTLAILQQVAAGFKHINPDLPYNPGFNNTEGGKSTSADAILDGLANPRDWDAELAGYVYLAILRGLSIKASLAWLEEDPQKPVKMKRGWNFGRLLKLAAIPAGAVAPASREGMEGWMSRGRSSAEEMLSPAITYADGRTVSIFDMEFPEA